MDREVASKFDIDIGKQQQQLLNSLSRTQYIVEQSHNAIQENSKLLDNYYAEGNLNGIISMYDNDIELIEPQTPTCRGLDALKVYYETMKKLRLLPHERCITELHSLSPFIVLERGKFKIQKSKNNFTDGRYFILWINRTNWKILQECRVLSM
ncbi:Vacuolar protein sorting-associated protein [Dirofilaria immitis]